MLKNLPKFSESDALINASTTTWQGTVQGAFRYEYSDYFTYV